jgi:hypothetical protein
MEPAQPQEPEIPQAPKTVPAPKAAPTSNPTPRAGAGGRIGERVLAWIVPKRYPQGAVYGTITIGTLLAAESGLHDSFADTVASLVIAVVLYWFAHSYADVLGLRLSQERLISWGELWDTFAQDWSIVRGAGAPLLALLVAWVVGAGKETALAAGLWTAVASLIVFELAAGIRSRAKPVEVALEVLVGATMGLALLLLRALLH